MFMDNIIQVIHVFSSSILKSSPCLIHWGLPVACYWPESDA